jgi:hypothetical protein
MKMQVALVLAAGGLLLVAACREQVARREPPPVTETPVATPTVSATTPPATSPSSAVATPTLTAATAAAKAAPLPVHPTATKLGVKRLVVARDVKGREPEGASETFIDGEQPRIFAFVEVDNPERAEGEITVSFVPPQGTREVPHGAIALSVGAERRWRTWAFTRTAHAAGEWHAVVKNAHGTVLADKSFVVGADPYTSKPNAT